MKNPESPLFEFDELYAEYGQMLYRFCFRLTGNQSEAEDLTQDVFVAALKGAKRFRGQCSVRTWLYQIAIFQARSLKARLRRERLVRLERPPCGDHLDTRIELERALANLPQRLRHAFLLVKVEQFTSLEAAQILNLPEGTVKFHVHEAILQLRKALTDSGSEIVAPLTEEQGITHAL